MLMTDDEGTYLVNTWPPIGLREFDGMKDDAERIVAVAHVQTVKLSDTL